MQFLYTGVVVFACQNQAQSNIHITPGRPEMGYMIQVIGLAEKEQLLLHFNLSESVLTSEVLCIGSPSQCVWNYLSYSMLVYTCRVYTI